MGLNQRQVMILVDAIEVALKHSFMEGYSESEHVELEAILDQVKGYRGINESKQITN